MRKFGWRAGVKGCNVQGIGLSEEKVIGNEVKDTIDEATRGIIMCGSIMGL